MATQVQLRRGNTSQTNAFTGAVAEITVDTDKETVVVHDGSTAGGFPLARESALSANLAFTQAAFNLANTANVTAEAGFSKANSANVLAQAAFDKANSAITANSVATLNNKTFDVSVSSNNIFSIQGQSIASYSGSGQVLLLQNSPTISVLNLSDSQLNLDGGTGSLYWSGQSGVAQAGDLKAGVYSSDPASNNSLFTFGGAGANVMSVGIEGSLFIGTALPSNDGGLNTTYPGWLVVQSGAKFGGTINTLGALQFDDPATANVIFADGTRQNTAYQTIVWTTANSAFDKANSANVLAQAAFDKANVANTIADSSYAFANTVNIKVDAAFSFSNTVNIKTDAAFSQANAANVLAQAAFNQANTANITAEAGFTKANSANVLAQAAFNQANTANVTAEAGFAKANTANTTAESAFSKANSANVLAQSAFDKANSAVANTGGSISGDLTITGNLTIIGQQIYANTQTVLIKDNIVTLNAAIDQSSAPSANAGLEIDRGSSANVYLLWNENSDVWQFTNDGTTYYTIADTSTLSSAFNLANTANITAEAAFARANAANILAQAAFNQANTANIKIDSGYAFANIVNIKVDSAFAFANIANIKVDSAFAFSNTVNIKTDAAFVRANAANVLAQAAFDKANQTAQLAFTTVSANGTSLVADANNDTLTITAAVANGIQILADATSDTLDIGLKPSGVTAGTYGNTSTAVTITIDQFGRITSVSQTAITAVETDPLALAYAIALG